MREIPFSEYLTVPEAGRVRPAAGSRTAIRTSEYFTSPEWFRLLADTCLLPGEEAVVHRLEEGGAGGFDLPLVRRRFRACGLGGRELHGLANFYSSYYCPPGLSDSAAARDALARWARAGAGQARPPDRLVFRALDEEDGTLAVLADGLRAGGYRAETFADFGNWYLPCDALSFDDYWRGRPSRLRNTVRRKRKALDGAHRVAVRRLWRPEQAAEATGCYQAVQRRAWQPDEPHERFIPELIRRGLAAGSLWLWLLEADGLAIAAQIWTLAADEATIFKLAFDKAWKASSPGTLLTHEAMRYGLEQGRFSRIDFGRGDDGYKAHWMTHRRQRWGLAAYSRQTPVGILLAMRNLAPRRARSLLGAAAGALAGAGRQDRG